ncbi:hypothetical protein GCM10010406_17410 [Streptomyces thermolineatus]|uniref:Uncharacterized protein n=1 Tax=Streptomyces thermolineatus TaxID=44033 RepID=A0ABN3LEP3_9ACTN
MRISVAGVTGVGRWPVTGRRNRSQGYDDPVATGCPGRPSACLPWHGRMRIRFRPCHGHREGEADPVGRGGREHDAPPDPRNT